MKERDKFENSNTFEGIVSFRAVLSSILENKSDRKILKVYYDAEKAKRKPKEFSFIKAKSYELGYTLELVKKQVIDDLTLGNSHGGLAFVCSDRNFSTLDTNTIEENGFYVMLDGVEDPYNFGYALRSLYAAGVDGVVLGVRNWMSAAGTVARSSAGCSELIDIFVDTPENAVRIFKASGFKVFSANIRDSVSLYDTDLRSPALFVIGGEKRGISRCVLDETDVNIRIEYGREFSGSLPTAQAAAIIAFEAARANGRIK